MNRTRQAILATMVLTCCLGGLPCAVLAQKAVGGVIQPQIAAEAATTRANEGAASRYQTAVTSRAPTFADGSTAGYAAGSTWLADDPYTNQISKAGAADWRRTPNHLLPGDETRSC